jgi:hypothetical protein
MDILAGEFSGENSVIRYRDGHMQTFLNRKFREDIDKHPENYITIDLLVK